MNIGRITGCTRVLGKEQGYKGLPVRDGQYTMPTGEVYASIETAWFPTPDELEAMIAGAPIIVQLLSSQHPPIMLYTGDKPE